jgi:hypothetical protein
MTGHVFPGGDDRCRRLRHTAARATVRGPRHDGTRGKRHGRQRDRSGGHGRSDGREPRAGRRRRCRLDGQSLDGRRRDGQRGGGLRHRRRCAGGCGRCGNRGRRRAGRGIGHGRGRGRGVGDGQGRRRRIGDRRRGCRARRDAGGQERRRIEVALRLGGNPHAEMDVRLREVGVAGRGDRSDTVALCHRRAARNRDRAEVRQCHGVAVGGRDRHALPR